MTEKKQPYLVMEGIYKTFRDNQVLANDNIHFEAEQGEIHAIVGENGAGKTTLMNILYGLEQADKGRISFKGKEVTIRSPHDANALGIGMVHQHFRLIPDFTVAENVVLGIEPLKFRLFLDRARIRNSVRAIIARYGFNLDPDKKTARLTVGEKQKVEIIRMLYRNDDLLILDEPTSVLAEQEVEKLFQTLRDLIKSGKTCIIITHKLNEVKRISDRISVLRKGRLIYRGENAGITKEEISRLIIGKEVLFKLNKQPQPFGPVSLELQDVTLQPKRGDHPLLDRINIRIRRGEIVGVTGINGNGLGELEDVVSGMRKVTAGRIIHNGEELTKYSIRELRQKKIAYIPSDRLKRGANLPFSIRENMIITRRLDFFKLGFYLKKEMENFTNYLMGHFSIDGHAELPLGKLSGGNIQKVVLARELAADSDFILFAEPTWGLDIRAAEFIYQQILKIREQQKAILFISTDLDEILGLSDRVLVLYKGRVVFNRENGKQITKRLIGEYMLGVHEKPQPDDSRTAGGGA